MHIWFTILDITSYAVGVIALIGILVIVIRKFGILSTINTKIIPKHQQEEVHKKLATERLERKFIRVSDWFQRFIRPGIATSFAWIKVQSQKLIRLERQAAVSVAKKSSEITGLTDNKIEKLKEQAAVAEGEKDYVEAEQKYIEMITLNPNSIEIYTQLGDMYMEMRDFKSADETYRYILVLMDKKMKDPKERHVPTGNDTAEINADIAEANIGLEKWDESMRFIEKSITFAPNNPKYLDLLFQISMKVGDFGRADQALTKLKEVNPENQKLQEFIEQLAQAEK